MASHPIYQIYSKLEDTELKIWRRFEVMENITVARLAYILMTMYEMKASHLFAFVREELVDTESKDIAPFSFKYELPSEDIDDPYTIDATSTTIKNLFSGKNNIIRFYYDFGDGWELALVCEKVNYDSDISGKSLPRVIDGEGYGIIEDCGGTAGLEEFASTYQESENIDTRCTDLNPFSFDIDDMNFRLRKVPRIYRDIYEHNLEPTEQSMRFLERKYKL